ncbi:MAG: hypothetical protein HN553_02265 [Opitutae bacterium]|jgi:hypothetical protein|nr:hypothetical protein [Opitutae bacterium]
MSHTLNKDGTPRKVGSGKTKGAGCYGEISWKQLKKVIAEDVKFPVSRVWLKNVGLHIEPASEVTKAVKVDTKKDTSKLPTPKVIHIQKGKGKTDKSLELGESKTYDPPPLFASGEINFDQF